MRDFVDRNAAEWAMYPRADRPNTKLAVFVHGFRGNYLSTWGKLPTLLSANADTNPPFDDWDYYFLGYPTKRMGTYLDISDLIGTVWRAARAGTGVFKQKYTDLALFGHSLGTLGIRQLLCAWHPAYGPRAAVRSVTLFGTPLGGSPFAVIGSLFYEIADALKANNPQLRMLRSWWDHAPGPPATRLFLGTDDRVVGFQRRELIEWTGDQAPPDLMNFDHSSMVKPADWKSSLISYLAAGLGP